MEYNHLTKTVCPICGKTDWCGHSEGQNGPLFYCGRIRQPLKTVVKGADGNEYLAVRDGDSYTGYGLKVNEDAAKERRKQEWIEEQKRTNPNFKVYKRSTKQQYKTVDYRDANPSYIDRSTYVREILSANTDSVILDKVYRALFKCSELTPEHKKILIEEWGAELFNKITAKHPIKSLPQNDFERFSYGAFQKCPWRKDIIRRMMEDEGVTKEEFIGIPGFYENSKGEIVMYRLSGIMFPVYDGNGRIVRIRIKDDFPSCKGTWHGHEGTFFYSTQQNGWCFRTENSTELVYQPKSRTSKVELEYGTYGVPLSDNGVKPKIEGKYKNFSSCKEYTDDKEKVIRNSLHNGCQSGSFPSLYCSDSDNFSLVFFTEGEKKAMVANTVMGIPCVSLPGVGTFKKAFEPLTSSGSLIDSLKEKGMKKAVIAYDADKNANVAVLKAEASCVKYFKENGIRLALAEWDASYGKGLDDILIKGVRPILYDIV